MIDWIGYTVTLGSNLLHGVPTRPVSRVEVCSVDALCKTVRSGGIAWLALLSEQDVSAYVSMEGNA